MNTPARTETELRRALEGQMKALAQSVRAYEAGHHWEAARIAVAVANLVFTKRATVSVLDRLGVKDQIGFIVTGYVERDGNYLAEHPLVDWLKGAPRQATFSDRFTTLASRHSKEDMLSRSNFANFEDWWGEFYVYKSPGWIKPPDDARPWLKSSVLTRRDIIMTLRDQEGGAHYDSRISNETYAGLMRDGAGCFLRMSDGSEQTVTGVVEATAAQIGHELMASLLTFFRDIPTDIGRRV